MPDEKKYLDDKGLETLWEQVKALIASKGNSFATIILEGENPILAEGEFGYDATNKITKIGDGVTPWNELPYFATVEPKVDFETSSWADISKVCEEGKAAETFTVGQERTVTWNGEPVKIRIVAINHYDKTDGSGKAGIVCQTVNCLPDVYYMIDSDSESSRVLSGYKNVEFNTDTAPEILEGFEEDLKKVIKEVNVLCDSGYHDSDVSQWGVEQVPVKLFLPAICELWSETSISNYWSGIPNEVACFNACGTQYEWYADNVPSTQNMGSSCTALQKTNGDESSSTTRWWTRNANLDIEGYWQCVNNDGNCSSYSTADAHSVAPCFCI